MVLAVLLLLVLVCNGISVMAPRHMPVKQGVLHCFYCNAYAMMLMVVDSNAGNDTIIPMSAMT